MGKQSRRKAETRAARWQPLVPASYRKFDNPLQAMVMADAKVWKNDTYTVQVRSMGSVEPFGEITWLSVKRNDHGTVHDWRDLQEIKNQLAGPEVEGVEIYPAESRLTDTANQYHLWCFPSGYALPFGFNGRLVMDDTNTPPEILALAPGAVNRPLRPPLNTKPCPRCGVLSMRSATRCQDCGEPL